MTKELNRILGIISFTALFLVFGCTEEYEKENNINQQNKNFEIKHKSFNELMKEQKFSSSYKKVDQKIKTVKLTSKTVMEQMYNFTIDTTLINEYSTNNYTSYNIGIIRDSLSNDYFENLFVEIDNSNVTTARILRYNINPISKLISSVITTPIIFNNTNVNGKEEPGGIECQTVSVYLQTQCGCPGHHWPGEAGCNCPNDPSTTVLLNSYTSCSSGGGGDVFDTGSLPNDPGTSILFTTTGGGSGGGSTAVPVIINYEKLRKKNFFISNFLTTAEKSWFNNQNEEVQGAIMSYMESTLIDENGFELFNASEYSLESKTFAKEIINAGINTILISATPFFKYPIGSNYATTYPLTTQLLKIEIPKSKLNNNIINKIVEITGLTPGRIKHDISWGKGPTVKIIQLDNYSPDTNEFTAGLFDEQHPNEIFIDIDLVNMIENNQLSCEDQELLQFFFTSAVLHEYVHLADNVDSIDYPGEEGSIFEASVYGIQTVNLIRDFYVQLIRKQ